MESMSITLVVSVHQTMQTYDTLWRLGSEAVDLCEQLGHNSIHDSPSIAASPPIKQKPKVSPMSGRKSEWVVKDLHSWTWSCRLSALIGPWYHTLLGRGSPAHQRTERMAHSGERLRTLHERFFHSRLRRHPVALVPGRWWIARLGLSCWRLLRKDTPPIPLFSPLLSSPLLSTLL